MWLPILALVIGFFLVFLPKGHIDVVYVDYIAVALVAGMDSLIGAIRAIMEEQFNDRIFISGFFSNALLSGLLLYLGDRLGIRNVAVAIMVALVIRIFNNLGFVRRFIIARLFEKRITAKNVYPEP